MDEELKELLQRQCEELATIRKLLVGIWVFLFGNAVLFIVKGLAPPSW